MWKDRETNTYTDDVKSFDNAPDNSSYIVIRGNYKKGTTIGEVSYAIHLATSVIPEVLKTSIYAGITLINIR